MKGHSAFAAGNVAVITGGADGIGYAAAQYFLSIGMRVCIADINGERLQEVAGNRENLIAIETDVSQLTEVQALKDKVYEHFGQVDVLMNNAGTGRPSGSWSGHQEWQDTLNINLWGVINGVHTFTANMIAQGTPALIINTGSKQGITCPPGNPAYNVSKAAIKAATESLQHELRNTENCMITAHLLVPGFTYTGMIRQFLPEKPDDAWTSEQVVEFMVQSVIRGDFYILCPDNDITREVDNKRMAWAMGDLVENRPPLSRWHPDYQQAFEDYMKS